MNVTNINNFAINKNKYRNLKNISTPVNFKGQNKDNNYNLHGIEALALRGGSFIKEASRRAKLLKKAIGIYNAQKTGKLSGAEAKKELLIQKYEGSEYQKYKNIIAACDNEKANLLWTYFINRRNNDFSEVIKKDENAEVFRRIVNLDSVNLNPFECVSDYDGFDEKSRKTYLDLLTCVENDEFEPTILKGWKNSDFTNDFKRSFSIYKTFKDIGIAPENTDEFFVFPINGSIAQYKKIEPSETFDYKGKTCVKLENQKYYQSEISPKTYINLFPPFDHSGQSASSDCYLLAAIYSMMNTPEGKAKILSCFSETSDGRLKVQLPNSKTFIMTDLEGNLPEGKTNEYNKYAHGNKGVKLLEAAFEEEICERRKQFILDYIKKHLNDFSKDSKQVKTYYEIAKSLLEEKEPGYVLTKHPGGLEPLLTIPEEESGFYGKEIYLVDFSKLKEKNPYYAYDTAGAFYRSDSGNIMEAYNVLGCNFIINGVPFNFKIKLCDSLLDYITEHNKELYLCVSAKDKQAKTYMEVPINFDKGILATHAYSLSIRKNPDTNEVEYVLINPYNSIREIVLTKDEMKEYIKSIAMVER